MEQKRVFSLLVDNTSSVLSRVSGLFTRRGYNIHSISAGTTMDIFRAKVVDVGIDSMIIELTGNQSKLDAFIRLVSDYEILELARTGVTGLSRGSDDVKFL